MVTEHCNHTVSIAVANKQNFTTASAYEQNSFSHPGKPDFSLDLQETYLIQSLRLLGLNLGQPWVELDSGHEALSDSQLPLFQSKHCLQQRLARSERDWRMDPSQQLS